MLTVGEIFRNERIRQNITLSQVEKSIKVRKKFLVAIEENNWKIFPSKIYIIGIIKNYANFLNLDSKKALAFFRRDYESKEEIKFKTRVSNKLLIPETKKIISILLTILFLIIFGYFSYQIKLYLSPPRITFISPKNNYFIKEDKVKIVGKVDKDASLTIFGERIYQNKEGIFEYELPLHPGDNELIIEVVGANGKKTTIKKIFTKKKLF